MLGKTIFNYVMLLFLIKKKLKKIFNKKWANLELLGFPHHSRKTWPSAETQEIAVVGK